MKTGFIVAAICLAANAAGAGTVDLHRDWNSQGAPVNTLVIGGEAADHVPVTLIADSTRYGELFVGRNLSVAGGAFNITPNLGVESAAGKAKLRGMLSSSAQLGPTRFTSVIEFAGRTGNFHMEMLSFSVGLNTYSAVRLSNVGSGLRFSHAARGISFYVQVLERRSTLGVTSSF